MIPIRFRGRPKDRCRRGHARLVCASTGWRRRHDHPEYSGRGEVLSFIPLAFLFRFGLGAISYAAATPRGLFAPLLVLGAQSGLLFGAASRLYLQPEAFAVVGMAAFFTGVVRAPTTGIVLVIEMTHSVTMLLPMLGACFTAMLVPTLLRDKPIYNSLREHMLHNSRALDD